MNFGERVQLEGRGTEENLLFEGHEDEVEQLLHRVLVELHGRGVDDFGEEIAA